MSQLSFPSTSTIEEVKSALERAIDQEQSTIQNARARLELYQNQLNALTGLTGVPSSATALEQAQLKPRSAETNGATANGAAAIASTGKKRSRSAATSSTEGTEESGRKEKEAETLLTKRFRNKTVAQAVAVVLSERPEAVLKAEEIASELYPASVLSQSKRVNQLLMQTLRGVLNQGVRRRFWKKVGSSPSTYQHLLPSEAKQAKAS